MFLLAYNSLLTPLRGVYPLYRLYASLRGADPRELRQRLGRVDPPDDDPETERGLPGSHLRSGIPCRSGHPAPPLWVQSASVGEVGVATILLTALRRARPSLPFHLTTTTRTGQALARRVLVREARVGYFPLDFRGAVRRMLAAVRPCCLILVETEIWPNLLAEAGRRGVPVIIANGRLSDRAFRRYRFVRPLLAGALRHVRFVGAQSSLDRDRFVALGLSPERVRVTGNLKFAAAPAIEDPGRLLRALRIEPQDELWIGGSTSEGEEEALLAAFRRAAPPAQGRRVLLIAPRKPERFEAVATMLAGSGMPWSRRSQVPGEGALGAGEVMGGGVGGGETADGVEGGGKPVEVSETTREGDALRGGETMRRGESADSPVGQPGPGRVILLDSLGELSSLYARADIAFVGGTLAPIGGHNIIEPAASGVAPVFGPHIQNLRDVASRLLEAGGAFQVQDASHLGALLARLAADPALRREAGARALRVVRENAGSVDATVREILPYLPASGNGDA